MKTKITTKPLETDYIKIKSDTPTESLDLSTLALHLEPEQEDKYIKGTKLHERLKGKNVLGADVLDYLLENPEKIPESWKGKSVYFWGTIYHDSGGDLCVRSLFWRGGLWGWGGEWLDRNWFRSDPAVVSQVSPKNLDTEKYSDTLPLELYQKLSDSMNKIGAALEDMTAILKKR